MLNELKKKYESNYNYIAIKFMKNLLKDKIKYLLFNDKIYIKMAYKKKMKKELDYSNIKTFSEKLQWLKLNNKDSLYTRLVDKYEVREFVKERIGERYLNEVYAVFDSEKDIRYEELPDQCVLKTTHNSGGVYIIENKDKNRENWNKIRLMLKLNLKQNYYYKFREYPYKDVKPRIICEKFLKDSRYGIPIDYKIFCFMGIPKIIQIHKDRFTNHVMGYYDVDWNKMDIEDENGEMLGKIERPDNLEEMLLLSEKISKDIKFCRVDFFDVDGKIYFGEITFFPAAGFKEFNPDEYNYLFGEWIKI